MLLNIIIQFTKRQTVRGQTLRCCSVACRHYKNCALDKGTTTNTCSALHLTLQYFERLMHLLHNYGDIIILEFKCQL